jgi:hypothetical protein
MSFAFDGCFASTELDANNACRSVVLRKLPKRFHFLTCPSCPMIVFLCHALFSPWLTESVARGYHPLGFCGAVTTWFIRAAATDDAE